jgi:intracellular sulfur oxidation DsrE/DsrF family protein
LELLVLGKAAPLADRLDKVARSGVVFAACENTMKRTNIDRKELVSYASPVDSGIAEVVRKQEAGWSYVRSGL